MAPLTFADTQNMVAFLSKSNASEGFDQIATATIKKVNDVVQLRALINEKKVVVSEDVIRRDLRLDDADRCLSAKRTAWNEFSCSMASAVICLATAPSPTTAPSPPSQDPTPTPNATPHASPTQEQPTTTSESTILEDSKAEEKGGCIQTWGKMEAIDVDEDITLVDIEKHEKVVTMDAEPQGRIDQEELNAATKDVNAAEPNVFDDEEMAQRLHDEEVKKAAAKDKQEKDDLEEAKKYQNLKRKPVSIAQAKKNMIIYLKNMARYKMKHFRGMTYEKVRPIFERENKKVQTLFKPDKDVEEPQKKRVAEETLLQESFKKLKAVKVSGSESTQENPSNDPKEMSEEDVQNMLEIVLVSKFKVEALQVKYPILDWEIHTEGSRTYWKIIRVGGITEAYQSFKDMLKGFDKEELVAL
nr:hypothetical protein [Tanacetum cinerariifolium]